MPSPGRGRRGRTSGVPAAVQEPLFEVRLRPERRYFRQMLESLTRSGFGVDTDPGAALAAEVTVARLFGTVWAADGAGRHDGAAEEEFGLGLVDYVRTRHTPTTVALLRTLAVVAPIREVREAATRAADVLTARGVPEPPWSPAVGAVTPGRCWVFADVYGDASTVICEFGYGADIRTADRHAVVVRVDHAGFSAAADAFLLADVDPTLRDLRYRSTRTGPMSTLRQVDPAWARALLARALARTDIIGGVPVGPDLAEARALVLARLAALPDDAQALPIEPEPTPEQVRSLVAQFLAGPEARDLPDAGQAERVATLVAEFGAALDPRQVARVGPAMWEAFLFDWLPAHAAEDLPAGAIAPVVSAWSAWAGRRMGLPGMARDHLGARLAEMLA